MPDRAFYRRHLPHFQPDEATFHVVFRLAGTLPALLLEELQRRSSTDERPRGDEPMPQNAALARQREHFRRLEAALDSGDHGPRWLAQPAVAAIIDEAPRYRDGRAFHRFASCIMPNHVHLLISLPPRDTQPAPSLTQVLHDLRGYTAWKCNELLGRAGRFWQEESYDRVVRDAREFERTLRYVVSNPVKARLVEGVDQWPWTYVVDQGM